MKPKQGRTSDEEIQAKINEIRGIIRGGGPKTSAQAEYLKGWSGSFRKFAEDLEQRDEVVNLGPDTDYAVLTWPQTLRGVADEAERAAGVFEKAPADRSMAENFYPGMGTSEGE